ncbi:error-prone DNA polymerase [Devosia sp. XJ19-1]|uniref:Error-prone DNA polymerase n=1 Tax=Devosia ureilytica TaxID=2952754 RepID=A0A9Q4ANH2_9HYPH|nr:error-prone DNA polymerase [Devosia ureilytica]MCP8882830.1 error-prone DNA polymerase [Devosia ureilytica]MCP8886802.1 error-prone DNA polymerase [Devosia ureilytica]
MSAVIALPRREGPARSRPLQTVDYVELVAASNFSFLRGASHPEELVSSALYMGMNAFGLCDRNSFAGVVRGYVAARDHDGRPPGFRYLVGVRLCFADGTPDIVAYPSDRAAYGRLCQLLTLGNQRGEKGKPKLVLADLFDDAEHGDFSSGQLFILMPYEDDWGLSETVLAQLSARAPGRVWVAGVPRFDGEDRARLNRVDQMARRHGARMLASNDVLYHEPGRRILADVVTCIREHKTLEEAGFLLSANAERHLKYPAEMARLFAEHPEALAETVLLAGRISFALDQLEYNYPEETIGNGETAQETLTRLTWIGAEKRFPEGLPDGTRAQIETELRLIDEKRYAAYFLTVQDIVRHARHDLGILCQGRGSAANSTVCYCLEITEVDPRKANLVFGRFISTERDEPPDIDVDFEHERREEVMQYVYNKYGGKRTGLTANVITYRSKSAIREAAKVFGVSEDTVSAFNQLHWGWGSGVDLAKVRGIGLNPDDPVLAQMFEVVKVLKGFPRHLSQHVGGFVITRDSLESLVPIGKTAMDSRTIIEWNKDDIDALKILKVDILALGMLTCLQRAFGLMEKHYDRKVELAELQTEEFRDPEAARPVYEMTHRADTIGVFQIESRAQMSMLPRLKPEVFYDLVIEVAIVRPGPIQGNMVHPYLRRRQGIEKVEYPSEALRAVLHRTLGVPLFQEQAMQIAIVGAGFSPGKADQLRRAMAAWQRTGKLAQFSDDFIGGMIGNGYTPEFAHQSFAQIQGFAEYGFPESHAASFALLVYASCWLKCHYPDVFVCALLNSQPMGFYAPSQLVRDAAEHGVEMRAVDINMSEVDSTLEDNGWDMRTHIWPRHAPMADHIYTKKAVRLGLSMVEGLAKKDSERIIAARGAGYGSVRDLWLRSGVPVASLEKLARADAFASLGLNRREALWAVKGLVGTHGAETLPLFAARPQLQTLQEEPAGLPLMAPGEEVIHDYATLSLSLKGHPVQFLRPMLQVRGTTRAQSLAHVANDIVVEVAGLVLVRQRPGTASGVIFVTLEDETGVSNIVVWPKLFEDDRLRKTLLSSRMLAVRGKVQSEQGVIHVIAQDMEDLTPYLLDLSHGKDIGDAVVARADEGKSGPPGSQSRDRNAIREIELARRRAYSALPGGRNFH